MMNYIKSCFIVKIIHIVIAFNLANTYIKLIPIRWLQVVLTKYRSKRG